MTKIIKELTRENLKIIKNQIEKNELIIFPTETVYGIGANALSKQAVTKIFEVKERAKNNPLIVHLKNKKEIEKYAIIQNDIERKLIDKFMPGPFTIILKKKDIIPDCVTANMNSVGIRIPNNKIAQEILNSVKVPIAAPSANISSRPSGTCVEDIISEFDNLVNYIIDGGKSKVGLESTVVKVIDNIPTILRPGYITYDDIISTIGKCNISKGVFNKIEQTEKVESPGMLYKHYAPKTKCLLVYSKNIKTLKKIVKEHIEDKTILLGSNNLKDIECYKFLNYGNNLEEICHNIFSLLRKADTFKANLIIIEGVEKEGLGLAIMNRLIRTANYNYIEK